MLQVNATEAKNHFGKLLDDVRRERIVVLSHKRPIGYFFSKEEYDAMSAAQDYLWALSAYDAHEDALNNDGYLGVEESKKFLDSILDV